MTAVALACCASFSAQPGHDTETYQLPQKPHIRALEVLNDSVAWFAANRGIWGYTLNGGKTWTVDSLKADTTYPGFRSLAALNDSCVMMLSVASPAYLFRTADRGKNWKLVYSNPHSDAFFDCMVFADEKNGYALADPIDGCFRLIETNDGGLTWKQKECDLLPRAVEGEACFAASNSNLRVYKDHIWFVTGGMRARVFHSEGKKNFTAVDSPLPSGEKMTGIYSLDFFDERTGAITGGHYERTGPDMVTMAVTDDGGRSWKPVRTERPFFGSCVKFRERGIATVTGHDGTFNVILRDGSVEEIRDAGGNPMKYHTLRYSPGGRYLWLAGPAGKIARIKTQPTTNTHTK